MDEDTKSGSPYSGEPTMDFDELFANVCKALSKRRWQRLWNAFTPPRYATHAAVMSLATEVGFSISTAKMMGVSIPFVGWNIPARWTTGHSPSTNTAMSGTITRNGSFWVADMSMGRLKARCERVLKRIQLEHEVP